MNEYESFEIIKKQLCKEAEQIAEQIQKNNTMSIQDLEKLDKIFHLKKNMLKSYEMENEEDISNQNGNGLSGYRGRGSNGRFVSRSYSEGYDKGYSEAMNDQAQTNNSYANGYNNGYSDAMSNGSGNHYRDFQNSMMPYPNRRW